jgi:hypothetical protein
MTIKRKWKRKKKLYSTQKVVRKDKRIMIRYPRIYREPIKELCKKYGIKGTQDLFDYLIVSGVCFRKKDIIDIIREHKEKYKQNLLDIKTKNLRGGKAPTTPQFGVNAFLYEADYKAMKDFLVEENVSQQDVLKILFLEGFLKEDARILNIIEQNRSLRINKRKKQIARLTNDKYISVLDIDDAKRILEELTAEYDQRNFDSDIEKMIKIKLKILERERLEKGRCHQNLDGNVDEELNRKARGLRISRARQITKLTKPIDK